LRTENSFGVKQAKLIAGIWCFYAAIDGGVTGITAPCSLSIVGFASRPTGTREPVVRQNRSLWVEIADAGDPHLAVTATRFFAEIG
jgi:hypothetical protein